MEQYIVRIDTPNVSVTLGSHMDSKVFEILRRVLPIKRVRVDYDHYMKQRNRVRFTVNSGTVVFSDTISSQLADELTMILNMSSHCGYANSRYKSGEYDNLLIHWLDKDYKSVTDKHRVMIGTRRNYNNIGRRNR